jgi:uncharacterized membrane protein YgdD (TMEM256/DUF423 family)
VARLFFQVGALLAGLAVAAGAFGAHALRARLEPRDLEIFETAARYQFYHALALIVTAWTIDRWPGPPAETAGWLFLVGIALFSGSLYALVLTNTRWLGAVTPFGGVSFMAGWVCLLLAARAGR